MLRINFPKARRLQLILSSKVIREDHVPPNLETAAGVDIAYSDLFSICAVVVHNFNNLQPRESMVAIKKTRVPYTPSMLFARELPLSVYTVKKLGIKPDVILVDGHGVAHPRRLGFASHLGLALNRPTIGVAKKLLCGKPVRQRGEQVHIEDNGEIVGAEVTTIAGLKPLYVSIGHKVSLERATSIVKCCVSRYRVPEPLRRAHILAKKVKRDRVESTR